VFNMYYNTICINIMQVAGWAQFEIWEELQQQAELSTCFPSRGSLNSLPRGTSAYNGLLIHD
jgi:hypothetical protein